MDHYVLEVESSDYLYPLLHGSNTWRHGDVLVAWSMLAGKDGCHVYVALVDGSTRRIELARRRVPCDPDAGAEVDEEALYSILFVEYRGAERIAEEIARQVTG